MKTVILSKVVLFSIALSGLAAAGAINPALADDGLSGISASAPNNPDFVLISSVKIKADQVAAFKAILLPYAEQTRKEEGNANYFANQSTDDQTEFAMNEHWKSDEARATHLAASYTVEFFKQAGPMFEPGYPIRKKFMELR